MSGSGSSELAALRMSGLRLPVVDVPPSVRFPPPPEPSEALLRQEAALMSGQPRERAGSGETAPRHLSAAAAALFERGNRSAEPCVRNDSTRGVLLDKVRGWHPPQLARIRGTRRTGHGTGQISFAPTRNAFGDSREGMRPHPCMKAIPVVGSVRQRH